MWMCTESDESDESDENNLKGQKHQARTEGTESRYDCDGHKIGKRDARVDALKMVILSDLHGCLEAFLQPMHHSGLIEFFSDKQVGRPHVRWTQDSTKLETCVLITGDITNRTRPHKETVGEMKKTVGEMKNEELLILAYIHHLNRTHPYFHNAIEVILGNHCYRNLLGHEPTHTSKLCLKSMNKQYSKERLVRGKNMTVSTLKQGKLTFMHAKDAQKRGQFCTGRQAFFVYHTDMSRDKIDKIAHDIVHYNIFPKHPIFFRDFLTFNVARFFPAFKILAVHGGLQLKHVGDINKHGVGEWCAWINHQAFKSILLHQKNDYVHGVVNDRQYALNRNCKELPGLDQINALVIGHTEVPEGQNVHCESHSPHMVIRADLKNNAYSQCTNGKFCLLHAQYITFSDNQARVVRSETARSTAVCCHDNITQYKFDCFQCRHLCMWKRNDFLELQTRVR